MRLPPLPRKLRKDNIIFIRRKRDNKKQVFIEFAVYDNKLFAGCIIYVTGSNLVFYDRLVNNKKYYQKLFRELMNKWHKERLYKKQLREILES